MFAKHCGYLIGAGRKGNRTQKPGLRVICSECMNCVQQKHKVSSEKIQLQETHIYIYINLYVPPFAISIPVV